MDIFTTTDVPSARSVKSLYIGEHESLKPLPLLSADLCGDWIADRHAQTFGTLPPLGLHRFEDATVGSEGFLLTQQRQIVVDLDLVHPWPRDRCRMLLSDAAQSAHPLNRALRGELPTKRLDAGATYVSLIRPGYMVYGHWLLDILPSAWLYFKIAPASDRPRRFIIARHSPVWARKMLELLFDIGADELIEFDDVNEALLAPDLVVPSFLRASPLFSPAMNEFVKDVRARVAVAADDVELPKRFMISRKDYRSESGRSLLNLAKLEEAAEKRGITSVTPESLSWPQQVRLFAEAEVVVGEFGSGLHNTIFSGVDCRTVTLGNRQMSWTQSAISALRGQRMQYVMPSAEIDTPEGGTAFEADASAFEQALDLALSHEIEGASVASKASRGRAPTIAFVGDSIFAVSNQFDFPAATHNVWRGPGFMVPFLTSQRVHNFREMNHGILGGASADILAAIDRIVAANADIYVENSGTNDVGFPLDLAKFAANKTAIWDRMLASGATVIATTLLPRRFANQINMDQLWAVNRWIKSQRHAKGGKFHVVDAATDFGDPLSPACSPRDGYTYDGLHPGDVGSYYAFRPIADLINLLIPPPLNAVNGVSDRQSPVNPGGNLLSNGLLQGDGGRLGDGGSLITGKVADRCSLDVATNGGDLRELTVHGAKGMGGDGRPEQIITLGGSYLAAGGNRVNEASCVVFRQLVEAPERCVAGDALELMAELSVDKGAAFAGAIEAHLQAGVYHDGVASYYVAGDGSTLGGPVPPEAFSGVFRRRP